MLQMLKAMEEQLRRTVRDTHPIWQRWRSYLTEQEVYQQVRMIGKTLPYRGVGSLTVVKHDNLMTGIGGVDRTRG